MKWEGNKKSMNILRVFLGLVFLSAGIFRIFNPGLAETEMSSLHLPNFTTWFIIIVEIIGGLCLLFNRYIKIVLTALIISLIIALTLGLVVNSREIIDQVQELFVYNLNPTDFFLHISFLVILVTLWFAYRK